MKKQSLIAFLSLLMSVAGLSFSTSTSAQGLGDVKQLCNNATTANKAMAKQAGYDLDALCNDVTSITQMKTVAPESPKVARPTVATEADTAPVEQVAAVVAPVAVAGVGDTKPAVELKPFGYDLFANAPTTFAPAASIPVSADYLLGPGDTLDILFYGKSNSQFSLEINREGFVDFPELGPVGLAGLTYGEAKEMLQARIAAQIIGTQVSISMGSLRSMQIFVLGEAFKPGAYTVSSLSTITHALISAGGISDIGSLRKIQLKRAGQLVAELDLYDLLMKGDTGNDVRVQAADVIYIPTVGSLVSVSGQVLRPAIYEIKGNERVEDLIALAGGLGEKAFAGSARIERIGSDGFMTALDLDLEEAASRNAFVRGGDHLTIDGIINRQKGSVNLTGHVNYPGIFAFKEGMRVSSLVSSIDQFPQGLDIEFGMISREDPLTGLISAVPFSPSNVLQSPGSTGDALLQSRDQVMFFFDRETRGPQLDGLITTLRAQARAGDLAKVVSIVGSRLPGTFPLVDGMRISDLLENAGGLKANYADLDYALLVREALADEGDISVFGVDLRAVLATPGGEHDVSLLPKDQVILFSKNESKAPALAGVVERLKRQTELGELAKVVRSGGTVKFPGEYPLTDDMSIKDLISASGGLVASAYSQSAEISRTSLEDPSAARSLIVVADLNLQSQTRLEPSDVAEFRTIPDFRETETITLEGEFVFPGTYAFEKGEMLSSVIERAGGFTDEAFIDGSVLLRVSLRQREEEEINRLVGLLDDELSANSLRDANSDIAVDEEKVSAQRSAIAQLSNMEATGRLVIPLSDIVSGLGRDVVLKDGDRLLIPKFSQEVTIIGEVRRPTSYLFDPNFGQADYIEQSGGYKDRADKSGLYIVKAGGEVIIPRRGLFRFQSAKRAVGPGDTIVVPLDTDDTRIRGVPLLAEVSTIIYQLALGSAAVKSFSNNP
ncbi:SLBB domain-containing protein [Luminiphilus sp.]|nr:SLBB domain-containing protein [Luminiphilus sp.]